MPGKIVNLLGLLLKDQVLAPIMKISLRQAPPKPDTVSDGCLTDGMRPRPTVANVC